MEHVTADDIEENVILPKKGYELTHPDSEGRIVEFAHPDLPQLTLRWEPLVTIGSQCQLIVNNNDQNVHENLLSKPSASCL